VVVVDAGVAARRKAWRHQPIHGGHAGHEAAPGGEHAPHFFERAPVLGALAPRREQGCGRRRIGVEADAGELVDEPGDEQDRARSVADLERAPVARGAKHAESEMDALALEPADERSRVVLDGIRRPAARETREKILVAPDHGRMR
jgi:hypothetical protein